jgi:hypothetical protein
MGNCNWVAWLERGIVLAHTFVCLLRSLVVSLPLFLQWDGSGHRNKLTLDKGSSIGQFLEKVRKSLSSDFHELRGLGPEGLIYIKEDLMLPQHYTFYDLIVTKARGKVRASERAAARTTAARIAGANATPAAGCRCSANSASLITHHLSFPSLCLFA